MWWVRFCLFLGFEIDLQVLEGCSRTFICALNLKAKDIYVKISSGQVWVIGKLAAYLHVLCGGDRIHSHVQCVGKWAKNTTSKFQYAFNESYIQMEHKHKWGRYRWRDGYNWGNNKTHTFSHWSSASERKGLLWMQLGHMKTKSKSHHQSYEAKSINIFYLNEKLYCLY